MPGGKVCSVAICRNNSKKVKESGEDIKFFSFPKDPAICKEWVRKCYRGDKFTAENKRICSRHFTPEDFEDKIKAHLMGIQPKVLKRTAIPSVELLPPTEQVKQPTSCSEHSKCADKLLDLDETSDETVSEQGPEVQLERRQDLELQIEALQEENKLLKRRIEDYEKSQNDLQKKVAELEQELRNPISPLKKRKRNI